MVEGQKAECTYTKYKRKEAFMGAVRSEPLGAVSDYAHSSAWCNIRIRAWR
jgi:hypothetical protein